MSDHKILNLLTTVTTFSYYPKRNHTSHALEGLNRLLHAELPHIQSCVINSRTYKYEIRCRSLSLLAIWDRADGTVCFASEIKDKLFIQ